MIALLIACLSFEILVHVLICITKARAKTVFDHLNRLPNNPALFSTILPDMSPRSVRKQALGQRSTSIKHVTSTSYKLEPAIWSRGNGQQIT